MTQPFNHESTNYHAAPLETPYLKAKQEWDQRLGKSFAEIRLWRWMTLLLVALLAIISISLLVVSAQQKNVVYIAQVEKGGQVVNVAPLTIPYQPDQAQVEYFLGQFIELVRGLPLDPVVAKQNWLKAYAYLSQRGAAQLNILMQQQNPLTLLGKQTITVTVNSINPLSAISYEIDWTETAVDNNGQTIAQKNWSGVFTVSVHAPKTQQQILINPLGIYIDNLHWSMRS